MTPGTPRSSRARSVSQGAWQDPFDAACQREDERTLVAAAMQCRQADRLVPVLQLVHEDCFRDPAVRQVWAAVRSWWSRYRRLPTPDELYRSLASDGAVEKSGGWAWLEGLLSSAPNSGPLEDAAWSLVAQSRAYAARVLLSAGIRRLERTNPETAAAILEQLATEIRTYAVAIRQLARHAAAWKTNMLRYLEALEEQLHGRPRS